MSKRFKICLSLWFAVLAVSLCCGETFAQELSSLRLGDGEAVESLELQVSPVPEAPKNEALPSEALPNSEMSPPPAAPIAMIADEEWSIQITPALKLKSELPLSEVPVDQHHAADQQHTADQPAMCGEQFASEYQRIYNSIPFNRAEFNRNPTYRHDSAMEIVTGNARHQTIVKHQPQQIVRPAAQSRRLNPAQFGYLRPALRLNYYRYFPSLNPYLNGLNLSGAF